MATSATSITIGWSTASGTVSGYRLARNIAVVGSTTALQWKFGRLSCGTTYVLSVWAYNDVGSGPASDLTASTGACKQKKLRTATVHASSWPRRPLH